jgi:hypothetical protein
MLRTMAAFTTARFLLKHGSSSFLAASVAGASLAYTGKERMDCETKLPSSNLRYRVSDDCDDGDEAASGLRSTPTYIYSPSTSLILTLSSSLFSLEPFSVRPFR